MKRVIYVKKVAPTVAGTGTTEMCGQAGPLESQGRADVTVLKILSSSAKLRLCF